MRWPFSASPFCSTEFPELWTSFVHAFIDASQAGGPTAPRPPEEVPPVPTVLPGVPRLVAVGDLHGDMGKARRAFRLAGLIDERDRWVGGTTTVVQVGDILDRGDQELEILYWLERLKRDAAAAGGALHVLNGNHETMNVAGQFRYVTLGGLLSFGRWLNLRRMEGALKSNCGCSSPADLSAALKGLADTPAKPPAAHSLERENAARIAALRPGGEVTRRFFARHPTVLQVGSTLFVHGGLLPQHAEYGLERINQETQAWMLGNGSDGSSGSSGSGSSGSSPGATVPKPHFLSGRKAVVWARHYSAEDAARCDCDTLAEALGMVPGAQRMVVGHTIQRNGINSACQGQVYRIDVGMSKGCGNGAPEVLEILEAEGKTEVRRITEVSPATAAAAAAAVAAVAAAQAKKKEGGGQQPHGGAVAAGGPNKENVQPAQQQRAA